MNKNHDVNGDKALIFDYIYGELDQAQRKLFEARLISDSGFKVLYDEAREFDHVVKPGTKPIIEDRRIKGVRWSLHKRLVQETNKRSSIIGKIANLWNMQVRFQTQLASILVAFILGIFLAQPEGQYGVQQNLTVDSQNNMSLLDLIEMNDYQIVDLDLRQVNPSSGEVKMSFSLASQTNVKGNLANSKIQNLLVETMKNDVNDAIRLDLIELLKNYVNADQVRNALVNSLLNDPNPGVRIVAAETLAKLSDDKSMRMALRKALQNDINSGVRVEAFQALAKHLDDIETIKTFKQYGSRDSNPYIRNQTQFLVKKLEQTKEPQT